MTDIILSSFLSLFALFGKEEQVDESRARQMLVSYLRHHFGIRNIDNYLSLYDDLRGAYEMAIDFDAHAAVASICENLHGRIRKEEAILLLLRIMEFCGMREGQESAIFRVMAEKFSVDDATYTDFSDFVLGRTTKHVMLHQLDGFAGPLKTLFVPAAGVLVFTYMGDDRVLLNDVPVLAGSYQVWLQSSVLKNQKGLPVYYSTILEAHQSSDGTLHKQAQSVEFCGRNLEFRYPNTDNGLHNLSFTLRSGELLAIMGGSGTGKSTLQSILNGSVQPQQGTLTINGHSITDPAARDLIGFVPQDDLLIEELTVYQNLWFTAKLCFDGLSREELDSRVMKTLKDLGLDVAKDLKVGSPINKYISGGQRKRLNIALELIREPAVLFLDEPTSGLSSSDAEKVINLLKEQTLKGKLIIVNIHQPSSDVYKLFDRLWLLDKGGYPVFDGNPIDAITYFKEAANYADADTSACPMCGNVNPEVVLNIIDEKALDNSGQLSDERKMSPREWHELYLRSREEQPQPAVGQIPATPQKKPGALRQFLIFLHRNVRTKITNLQYLGIALLEAPLLALVCAFLTRFAPPEGYSVMENKNLVSYFFMSVIVATFTGMSGSAEEIFRDRLLLKRERFLHLSHVSYVCSKIVYVAVLALIQTFLYILVGNAIMGIQGLFAPWWLILFTTAFLSSLIGLLLSQCLSSIVAIYISIPILLIPQILLCGLVVSFSDLTPRSTTGNVPVVGDLIPSRWAFEALAVTSFIDNAYERPFFQLNREKYETQFYHVGYLYEMQSQLETAADERQRGVAVDPAHMDVIRTNLPLVTTFCQAQPYAGDWSEGSVRSYLKALERTLAERSNRVTIQADRLMSRYIRQYGKDEMRALKRAHYNLKLEEFLVGTEHGKLFDIVGSHIVPRAGIVYLTPQSRCGRAPFYSSRKIIGSHSVKTLWFNLFMMLLMCIFFAALLLADFPGRWLRKET